MKEVGVDTSKYHFKHDDSVYDFNATARSYSRGSDAGVIPDPDHNIDLSSQALSSKEQVIRNVIHELVEQSYARKYGRGKSILDYDTQAAHKFAIKVERAFMRRGIVKKALKRK